mgnify:CR=1 FL=1
MGRTQRGSSSFSRENVLAMPVVKGIKTDKEKFAGANATYTIEDPAAATVILKTGDKKTTKKVKVDKVVIDSKTYTVVGIAANALLRRLYPLVSAECC